MEYHKFNFEKYALDCIMCLMGFERADILRWLYRLETYHNGWYRYFVGACVVRTYDRYFFKVAQLRDTMMDSEDTTIRSRGYGLLHCLEDVFQATMLFVSALQMSNERKRDKYFYNEGDPIPVLTTSICNSKVYIFGPVDEY